MRESVGYRGLDPRISPVTQYLLMATAKYVDGWVEPGHDYLETAALVPFVMAGHVVPAIRRGRVPLLMAGTSPAMTV